MPVFKVKGKIEIPFVCEVTALNDLDAVDWIERKSASHIYIWLTAPSWVRARNEHIASFDSAEVKVVDVEEKPSFDSAEVKVVDVEEKRDG